MNTPATAEQRASAYKGRLTQAFANLAQIDEQREKLTAEIEAIRNYLGGITLGQSIAAEQQRAKEAAEALTRAGECLDNEYPVNAGGSD